MAACFCDGRCIRESQVTGGSRGSAAAFSLPRFARRAKRGVSAEERPLKAGGEVAHETGEGEAAILRHAVVERGAQPPHRAVPPQPDETLLFRGS